MIPVFRPFRPVVWYVLPGALILGLLYLQTWQDKRSNDRRVGISSQSVADGLLISDVQPGRPADRAGLKDGDRLIAINGHAVADWRDYDRVAAGFAKGVAVRFSVVRAGEAREITVIPGVPQDWPLLLFNAVTVLGYLGLGLLARLQGGQELKARLLYYFTLAVAFELVLPLGEVGAVALAIAGNSAFYLITGVQMGLELHLASSLPDRHPMLRGRPWIVPTYYAIGLTLAVAASLTYAFENLGGNPFPWSNDFVQSLLFDWGLPLWATAVVLLLGTQALRHPEPRGRQQAGLILLGVLPWVGTVYVGTVRQILGQPPLAVLDVVWPLVIAAYPVAIFVAIFRYQLFDIEAVVRRSLLYTSLTTTLILLFYAALGAGGFLFSQLVEGAVASLWMVSAATLLLGLLFSPLRQWLQRAIDRRFFPERHAVRQRLVALAAELPALGKLPLMGQHLVTRLAEIFEVPSATLLLATSRTEHLVTLASTQVDFAEDLERSFLLSPDDPAVQHLRRSARPMPIEQASSRSASFRHRVGNLAAQIAVPLMNQDQLVGLLLLSEKSTRRPFTSEELELLSLLGHLVATVFENARLFESATFESLTGLYRREAILEQLERELARALRYHRPLTIALADLDHFKSVNDEFGHLAGDILLKRVAQSLAAGLRGSDSIGRFGGEEFLFILPETDLAGAVAVAEKLRMAIEELKVAIDDRHVVGVTLSIGLAEIADVEALPAPSAHRLIEASDRALYRAKRAGRNRIETELLQAS